jgi:hypothetical protein
MTSWSIPACRRSRNALSSFTWISRVRKTMLRIFRMSKPSIPWTHSLPQTHNLSLSSLMVKNKKWEYLHRLVFFSKRLWALPPSDPYFDKEPRNQEAEMPCLTHDHDPLPSSHIPWNGLDLIDFLFSSGSPFRQCRCWEKTWWLFWTSSTSSMWLGWGKGPERTSCSDLAWLMHLGAWDSSWSMSRQERRVSWTILRTGYAECCLPSDPSSPLSKLVYRQLLASSRIPRSLVPFLNSQPYPRIFSSHQSDSYAFDSPSLTSWPQEANDLIPLLICWSSSWIGNWVTWDTTQRRSSTSFSTNLDM